MVRSIGGLSFDEDTFKFLQINSCLYLSKGLAEYVAVLGIDGFLIPTGKHRSFLDILKNTYSMPSKFNSDFMAPQRSQDLVEVVKRQAGANMHPLSFINVNSEVLDPRWVNKLINEDHLRISKQYVRFVWACQYGCLFM